MKAKLRTKAGAVLAMTVDEGGRSASIAKCPLCPAAPAPVKGDGITHHDHDTYYAQGRCLACGEVLGVIETTVDTVFGIDEDIAVLKGRPRVY